MTNLQGAVAFYEMLGLREVYCNERGVLMSAGNTRLFLFATRQVNSPPVGRKLGLFENAPGIDHISFAVADVDGIYARLRETAVEFDGEPQDQSWGARMVGSALLWHIRLLEHSGGGVNQMALPRAILLARSWFRQLTTP